MKALKTVVTNVVQVGRLKLHPLDLLLRMSPLAFLQCLVYATISGEMADVIEFVFDDFVSFFPPEHRLYGP